MPQQKIALSLVADSVVLPLPLEHDEKVTKSSLIEANELVAKLRFTSVVDFGTMQGRRLSQHLNFLMSCSHYLENEDKTTLNLLNLTCGIGSAFMMVAHLIMAVR